MNTQEDDVEISFLALRIKQPIGNFYIGGIKASELFKIAYFDIRGLRTENGIDTYLGLQRELKLNRVQEISEYVKTVDATFPSAVILAVDERCTEFQNVDDDDPNSPLVRLKLKNYNRPHEGEDPILFREVARVLDGQHRIAGLEGYGGDDFEVNVAVFVGLDIASQANIFSVVNLAQTKVNHSLVYDLLAYDRSRSPEKTCHEIAVALDTAPKSPLHERIKRLGTATEGRFGETLSQATFVRGLLPYISNTVMKDRDIGKRGGKWPKIPSDEIDKLIFRPLFLAEKDEDIAANLWAYFQAVRERWQEAWEWTGQGRILNKTTGYQALMQFLRPLYLYLGRPGDVIKKEQYLSVLRQVRLESEDFNTTTFKPGSSGVSELRKVLLQSIGQ